MYGFLIDLDGTLYRGNTAIPHAAAFIAFLQKQAFPYLLVTNNSSRTPDSIADHLHHLGMAVPAERIVTSALATANYMKHLPRGNSVYCIGEHGLQLALKEQGFTLIQDARQTKHVDYVVQGIDRQFTYEKLSLAVNFIGMGALSINTNSDRLLPSDTSLFPGGGSIAAAIRYATDIEPVVIGKPSSILFEYAIQRLQVPHEAVWVIGDNVTTDIRGGHQVGCKTGLILTGITTSENLQNELGKAQVNPHLICEHLHEFATQLGYAL